MAWKPKWKALNPAEWETVSQSPTLRVLASKARAGSWCYIKVETKRPEKRFSFRWNGRRLTDKAELLRCEHVTPGTVATVENVLIEKGFGVKEEPVGETPPKKGPARARLDLARWNLLFTDEPKNSSWPWARRVRIAHFQRYEPGNWLACASPCG